MWVPLVTTALSIFNSILVFAGAEMPARVIHLPSKESAFLWVDGSPWVQMCVGKMLLDSVSV